ncbi:adenylate cyclase [Mycobacterium sp. ACS4331]|nr:adenylate cyclase [Mycobacterium sp. ACS4331]
MRRARRDNPCVSSRNAHYADSAARRFRVLKIATWIAAAVSGAFGIWQLVGGFGVERIAAINIASALVFLTIPLLRRFGELVPAITFVIAAYASVSFMAWTIGTGSGLQFYFLISASIVVLALGTDRIVLASALVAVGAILVVVLELNVPRSTGVMPDWSLTIGFISSVASSCLMAFATVWYVLREVGRAEVAMELEYQRSEQLLANILPSTIAERLKDPDHDMIADAYDDASILFADIAGFTRRASETAPCDLVGFLDRLYTQFDALVDQHGLEKIKTTGDSYMVVSGVPTPRPDHLAALALLALDMATTVAGLRDPEGRPVPIRIGLAAGPVVAGVVGARRFFYDVWGDAVNVASRMETTDQEGRIQVPDAVYRRLRDDFVFEERGDVEIKGKGVMHTWYLTGRRSEPVVTPREGAVGATGRR